MDENGELESVSLYKMPVNIDRSYIEKYVEEYKYICHFPPKPIVPKVLDLDLVCVKSVGEPNYRILAKHRLLSFSTNESENFGDKWVREVENNLEISRKFSNFAFIQINFHNSNGIVAKLFFGNRPQYTTSKWFSRTTFFRSDVYDKNNLEQFIKLKNPYKCYLNSDYNSKKYELAYIDREYTVDCNVEKYITGIFSDDHLCHNTWKDDRNTRHVIILSKKSEGAVSDNWMYMDKLEIFGLTLGK
ncbi:hypothetical protein SNEBB_001493 [Seison nebaliae]|nr:hypothetical protein SNEBB_001493 [Seison nebaliae]